MIRGRLRSKFSSWNHRRRASPLILTQAGKTAACKLTERPKWILSAAEGILFAGGRRCDSMRKLVLHSSYKGFVTLLGRIFRTMAQNARSQDLVILVVCVLF